MLINCISFSISSQEVAMVLELLSKLIHIVQLPTLKMSEHMSIAIKQWFPFGRISGHQQLQLLSKPSTTHKGMWLRSKPKVEVHIKEEVRMVATNISSRRAEVYGTISFIIEPEVDVNGAKLELLFCKLSGLPSVLFHPSVLVSVEKTGYHLNIQEHILERSISLCHYTSLLETPPIQPILKIRTFDAQSRMLIFIQLHISSSTIRNMLNRLEVRLTMPIGNRIGRILTAANQMIGSVSLIKDGCQMLWNLTPLTSTSSNNTKLKEDAILNVDVEMDKLDVSVIDTQAVVSTTYHKLKLTINLNIKTTHISSKFFLILPFLSYTTLEDLVYSSGLNFVWSTVIIMPTNRIQVCFM